MLLDHDLRRSAGVRWARLCHAAVGVLLCCLQLSGAARAQTIAEYSRSQRAVIEAEIAKNNLKALSDAAPPIRSIGTAPLAASRPANDGGQWPDAQAQTAALQRPPEQDLNARPPHLSVAGVFILPSTAMAEFSVDGLAHRVAVGDPIPGTPWKLRSLSPDKVVLVDRVAPAPSRKTRKIPGRPTVTRVLPVPGAKP